MLSSCTLLSLAPPAAPAPGKFSPAVLQLRMKQSWGAATCKVPRAPPFVCHAYNIPPTALVYPSRGNHGNWKIGDDEDRITLELKVGAETKEGDLEVTTVKDALTVWLVIRKTGDRSDGSLLATEPDARLQMPPGYDKKNVMKAEILRNGWLEIRIDKPKPQIEKIQVTKQKTETQSSSNSKGVAASADNKDK
ncbi:unnamed protein product [Urochloa decumbens]|uniref:SHSP domain-containing protein n=1 Tax=Urochloa decumbens TaxID=240449 RepID=A0ABC8VIN5_9POAL